MIRFENLTKKYGETVILNKIDGCVEKGKAIAIIGPSGSGKSTLLRCMNFLEEPDEGEVHIDNLVVDPSHKALRALRRKVGMVFQNFYLFPHMSVLENIIFAPMKVLKQKRTEAEHVALNLLAKVGLEELRDRYPARLSGGQKQRVAIARALAMNPQVMLFDEPTSALDPEMVKEVLDVIRDLHRDHLTMMIVTHEMQFARDVADEIWFLDQGEVLEIAAPRDFFNAPKTKRAQEFLAKVL